MINLLPKEEKEVVIKIKRVRFVTLACIFLFYTTIVASIALFPAYLLSLEKEKELVQVYEKLQSEESTKETNSLNAVVKDINTKLSVLPNDKSKEFSKEFFDAIISRKGSLVSVDGLSYGKDSEGLNIGRVSGVAKTRSSLISFVDELKKVPEFVDVSVPISNLVKDRDIIFNFEFILP